jgi:ABC-type multidrug transport system fused ATPase/permease subunit
MLLQENVCLKHNLDIEDAEPRKIMAKLPEFQSLFDLSFLPDQLTWVNWLKTVPEYQVDPNCTFAQIVVPTLDSIRINNNLNRLLNAGKHTLIVGPTGTGKSISVL